MNNYSASVVKTISSATTRMFGLMGVGIFVTAIISYFVANSPTILSLIISNIALLISLLFIQIAISIAISSSLQRMSTATATALFILYSAINGLTLSPIFLVYTTSSLTAVFFITAAIFSIMAVYGMVTKSDLRPMGFFLVASLIGIFILSLINLFLKSAQLDMTLAFFGVLIFSGLTAYDLQRIRELFAKMAYDDESQQKIAVIGAMTLYLDFMNIAIYLLRIIGKKNDNR